MVFRSSSRLHLHKETKRSNAHCTPMQTQAAEDTTYFCIELLSTTVESVQIGPRNTAMRILNSAAIINSVFVAREFWHVVVVPERKENILDRWSACNRIPIAQNIPLGGVFGSRGRKRETPHVYRCRILTSTAAVARMCDAEGKIGLFTFSQCCHRFLKIAR
jgi:hypothetical protein